MKTNIKPNSWLNTILIDETGKGSQLKTKRKNESIRLKIDYETQFLFNPMLNDNETNITS
jgi:hypothetical protein